MPTAPLSVPDIRARVRGRVIEPGDPDYDTARVVFAGGVDLRPAVIVQVADTDDVVAVVRCARETGVDLAVRSGGHSSVGHGVCEGGIVLDVRAMKAIEIDVEGKTAWAEAGLTAGEYTRAVGVHGLATGFGDFGTVGISGITLGGGVGFLSRRDGLTIDNVLAAEIVTAQGDTLLVSKESHPDLFWAIRGGGGNFGVVTRFQYRLSELSEFYGGTLIMPATPETVAGFVAATQEAPEEFSAVINVMPAPPMPFLAEEHHGQVVIFATVAFAGDEDAGKRVLAPFRELATPLADLVRAMPYAQMYPEGPQGGEDFRPMIVSRTMFVDHIGDSEAHNIVTSLKESDATMRMVQLRVLGGAIARVPSDATAFAHRTGRIMLNVAAFYTSPQDKVVRQAWVDNLHGALRQGDSGGYVAFIGDEEEAGVRRAYPGATWERLRRVKTIYDPSNMFRLNQNIPPQSA